MGSKKVICSSAYMLRILKVNVRALYKFSFDSLWFFNDFFNSHSFLPRFLNAHSLCFAKSPCGYTGYSPTDKLSKANNSQFNMFSNKNSMEVVQEI